MGKDNQPKKDFDVAKRGKKAKDIYDKILAGRAKGKDVVMGSEEGEPDIGDRMSYHYQVMDMSSKKDK